MNPLVSVIIPVFNDATYVGQAITSALNQTYKNYEIIVANDGSTDATADILDSFGSKITVLNLDHSGICASRNAAIRKSRGEFIALLDSDDLWEPEKLQKQIDYFNKHPEFALVYCYNINFTDETEDSVAIVKKVDFEGFIFKDLFFKNGFANSTIIIRRDAFDAVGGYDESLMAMEDYELNLRISRKYQIGRVPESLMRRRIHSSNFYAIGYDNQYTYQLPVYDKLLSDATVRTDLSTTKKSFMNAFILKFIYKNLYDDHVEFIPQKLEDLKKYAPASVPIAQKFIESHDITSSIWATLIPEFDAWQADVAHKALLFKDRRKHNFNAGSKRFANK